MRDPGLVIEMDIGYDPDDYLMLLHLLMRNVPIHALLVSPGHPSQVALYCAARRNRVACLAPTHRTDNPIRPKTALSHHPIAD